jgi:hypothetical protein
MVPVVTGFTIPTDSSAGVGVRVSRPACGETDGPLGALFIARAFQSLDVQVHLLSDDGAKKALRLGLESVRIPTTIVTDLIQPSSRLWKRPDAAKTCRDLIRFQTKTLTHLIALERAGPNHTLHSLLKQRGIDDAAVSSFAASVPESSRGHHYTMSGRNIDELTSPAHLLFEERADDPRNIKTIGIGDGGNEIGMGKIPWDTIRRNIPNGDLIACRVPTDYLIVAGVSNWGAYALAAGIALLRDVELPAELFDPNRERELLWGMAGRSPLVDGVTGKQEATVDGLSWDDYIKPLVEIGKIVRG